jgi:hypothetical protein
MKSSFCTANNCVDVEFVTSSFCTKGSCVEVGWTHACADCNCVEVGFMKSSRCTRGDCVEVESGVEEILVPRLQGQGRSGAALHP